MARYAEFAELEAYLGDREGIELPIQPEAERMLDRASELIDTKTLHWADRYWVEPRPTPLDDRQTALNRAAVRQVEFWLETGEEHDIVGLTGNVQVVTGRSSSSRQPERLAPRARDILVDAGLLSTRVAIV